MTGLMLVMLALIGIGLARVIDILVDIRGYLRRMNDRQG